MLGYLNFESPFDQDGWYCTKDIVGLIIMDLSKLLEEIVI